MQNAMQAAVGRATRTVWKKVVPPVLKDGPLPAYRVAEKLGKDINTTTVALSYLYQAGNLARVPFRDTNSPNTRFAYCLPEHAEASDKIVPITRKKRGRPAGKTAVKAGTRGGARANKKGALRVTFAFNVSGRELRLTEKEARQMFGLLREWFERS